MHEIKGTFEVKETKTILLGLGERIVSANVATNGTSSVENLQFIVYRDSLSDNISIGQNELYA